MAHEHKTQEECLRACTLSPGCKAFDAGGVVGTFAYGGPPMSGNGNQEVFQAGDCFLSYDTISTIKAGDVGMTNQLELFQKVEAQKVRAVASVTLQAPTLILKQERNGRGGAACCPEPSTFGPFLSTFPDM